jgi:hypothetical protein
MLVGDKDASRKHVLGATKMVQISGGPQTVGQNRFLLLLLNAFVYKKGLFDPEAGAPCGDTYSYLANYY